MTEHRRYYRFRVWNGLDDLADFLNPAVATGNLLNVSSVPSDTAPYIASPPSGGGREVDPLTGECTIGSMTVSVIDAVTDAASEPVAADDFETYNSATIQDEWTFPDPNDGDFELGITLPNGARPAYSGRQYLNGNMSLSEQPASDEQFCTHTFTAADGIQPETEYTVRVRYRCFHSVGVSNPPTTTREAFAGLRVEGVTAKSEQLTVQNDYWQSLAVTATSTSEGTLTVEVGFIDILVTAAPLTRLTGFDLVEVFEGAIIGEGRVVTKNLANVSARWHLLSRRSVVELSEDGNDWSTLHSGYLNRHGLQGGLLWEFTIGDSERAENQIELFREAGPPSNAGGVMQSPSMILGGPVTSGLVDRGDTPLVVYGSQPDYGPVRFEVIALAGVPDRQLSMVFKSGYLRPYFDGPANGIERDEERSINNYVRRHFTRDTVTFESDAGQLRSSHGYHSGLVARLTRVSDGAVFYRTIIAAPAWHRWSGDIIQVPTPHEDGIVDGTGRLRVDWPDPTGGDVTDIMGREMDATDDARPTVGTEFDVEVWATEVSEASRWHEKGRPLDLLTHHLAAAGETWNQSSADAVTAIINTMFGATSNVKVELLHEKPMTLRQYKNMLFANFRFSERRNADGELEFFSITNSPPTAGLSIIANDLREPGIPHESDEQSIVTRVEVECLSLQPVRPDGLLDDYSTEYNADGLATARFTVEGASDTLVASSPRTAKVSLPGRILVDGKPVTGETFVSWSRALGDFLVDWLSGGLPTAELPCLPHVTAQVGDELSVLLPHMPVPVIGAEPITQRGQTARLMRVVRREETPAGPNLTLVDAPVAPLEPIDPPPGAVVTDDPEAPPVEFTTLFTLATHPTDPTRVARATVSFSWSFSGTPSDSRFQYHVGASAPAGDGLEMGSVATTAGNTVDTPAVAAGALVWVRVRTYLDGSPISSWSPWQSVLLSAVAANAVTSDFGSGTVHVTSDFGSGDVDVTSSFA